MTEIVDIGAALQAAKAESETRARILREKIARAKRVIERSEALLDRLNVDLVRRAQEITNSFLQIEVTEPAGKGGRRRMAKWSLDEPIRAMIRTMTDPIVTIPLVCDEWNRSNPERIAGRTTIRGVLERLADDGELVVVERGRQGSRNVRQYRLASVEPAAEGEEAVTH